jgi:DNA polymerase III sliding clamp (beta) subunit (PCNA family)
MIAFGCQAKNLVKKLTVLSKVQMGSKKSLAPISVRVNDNHNLCELCLCFDSNYNQYSTYIDYYANVDIITSHGNGMFVIPSFIKLLEILKTIEPDGYIVTRFESDNKVIISHDYDVIFECDSNVPDDSYIHLLNTFEFKKGFKLPSALLDYTSNLLKVIPPKKDSKDARFNSIAFDKHPLQSNCVSVMRTDAIRLMYYPISLDTEWPFGCIVVPQDVMAWVSKLKKKKSDNVLIKSHDYGLLLEYDDYRVVCLVDKTFLSYVDFIKADVNCSLTVVKERFLKAVEYATMGDSKNVVTIRAKNQEAEVFMNSYMEIEQLRKSRLNCALDGGKEFDFSIYGSQLLSLLKLCGETVSIHKLSMKQLYLITSVGKDFQYIIMGVTV